MARKSKKVSRPRKTKSPKRTKRPRSSKKQSSRKRRKTLRKMKKMRGGGELTDYYKQKFHINLSIRDCINLLRQDTRNIVFLFRTNENGELRLSYKKNKKIIHVKLKNFDDIEFLTNDTIKVPLKSGTLVLKNYKESTQNPNEQLTLKFQELATQKMRIEKTFEQYSKVLELLSTKDTKEVLNYTAIATTLFSNIKTNVVDNKVVRISYGGLLWDISKKKDNGYIISDGFDETYYFSNMEQLRTILEIYIHLPNDYQINYL